MEMKRYVVLILTVVFATLFGWALCYATHYHDQPYCPTEDSCSIDYRDGSWHIDEVTP